LSVLGNPTPKDQIARKDNPPPTFLFLPIQLSNSKAKPKPRIPRTKSAPANEPGFNTLRKSREKPTAPAAIPRSAAVDECGIGPAGFPVKRVSQILRKMFAELNIHMNMFGF